LRVHIYVVLPDVTGRKVLSRLGKKIQKAQGVCSYENKMLANQNEIESKRKPFST